MTKIIKLPKRAKPSKALSKSALRPDLTRAYVAKVNGHRELVASDSYILARVPVPDDTPLGSVTADALKRIERGEAHEVTVKGAVRFTTPDGTPVEYHAPEQTKLPFPDVVESWDPSGFQVVTIGLNPALLKNLADAIGAGNAVRLEVLVHDDGKAKAGAMRVSSSTDGAGEGLIMPLRLGA